MELHEGSCIAILGCSDGNKKEYLESIEKTVSALTQMGINPVVYESAFADSQNKTLDAKIRANDLNQAFADKTIDGIFDVSGGDAAKETLPFIDFDMISKNKKPYFGYSDNSVIINPLRQRCGIECFYYQLKFLGANGENQKLFAELIKNNGSSNSDIFKFNYEFLQGTKLTGKEIVGGNIRCTLKLFDTEFKPDFLDRVLFLESYGGDLEKLEGFYKTLKNDGAFEKCSSVLLGNHSFVNKQGKMQELYKMVLEIIDNPELPVAFTMDLGHQENARCLDYQLSF